MSRPLSFQEKFKDRIGVIGKEGVIGLVNQTENQIHSNKLEGNKIYEVNDLNKYQKNSNNLANNGNMVINNPKILNNNYPIQQGNNPINNNINQINPIINPQHNFIPPNMNPYQAYPFNPMQGYMYGGLPPPNHMYNNPMIQPYYNQFPNSQNYNSSPSLMYNPQQQINQIPYSKQNNFLPNAQFPVKLINNNIQNDYNQPEQKSILNMNNRERLKNKNEANNSKLLEKNQRSFSSKAKYDKNINSSNLNNSNLRDQFSSIEKAQNTHPDSFSSNYKQNNNKSLNNDISYHPYSLKDYKELGNGKIVLGGLGPNIGTKEWEERLIKMKKIVEYSENIKKTQKVLLKPLKETPIDIIEREKKEKLESSSRNKAAEYGKKIKKIKLTRYDNDLIYDHRPFNLNNKINDNDDLVKFENSKIDEDKINKDMKEFNEIQKKREYLSQQVNAFKDDIMK